MSRKSDVAKQLEEKARLKIGTEFSELIELYESTTQGIVYDDIDSQLPVQLFSKLEDLLNVHLKDCSKCRMQTKFGRPPVQKELITIINLSAVCGEFLEANKSDVFLPLYGILKEIESEILIEIGKTRPSETEKKNLENKLAETNTPTLASIRARKEELNRLKSYSNIKVPMIERVEYLLKQRADVSQYFGFVATDVYFQFKGTTLISLSQFQEKASGMLKKLDQDTQEEIKNWETQNNQNFELDGNRVLETLQEQAKLSEEPKQLKPEKQATPIKPTPRTSRQSGSVSSRSSSDSLKSPLAKKDSKVPEPTLTNIIEETILPPGLFRIQPNQYQTFESIKIDESDELDEVEGSTESKFDYENTKILENDEKAFRVVVRIRPLQPREIEAGDLDVVNPHEDGKTVKFSQTSLAQSTVSLTFDACVAGTLSQENFLPLSGIQPLIAACLAGKSVTCMAYGQTGSGKTFSMSGPEDYVGANKHDVLVDSHKIPESIKSICRDIVTEQELYQGLIPRTIKEIFRAIKLIKKKNPSTKVSVEATYVEIYNEKVFDLLRPSSNVTVRQHPKFGFYADEVFSAKCDSVQEMMKVFVMGTFNKKVSSTAMNSESSRSHTLLSIAVKQTFTSITGETTIQGKLTLVDLAGSERLKQTGVRDHEETSNINKSLFALSNCIQRLGTGRDHVPFRDSNLTKLLMESLGATAKSLLICCMSPSSRYIDESVNTLMFASKAANIEKQNVVNLTPHELEVQQLKDIIEKLQETNLQEKNELEKKVSKCQTQITILRNLLTENGIQIPEMDMEDIKETTQEEIKEVAKQVETDQNQVATNEQNQESTPQKLSKGFAKPLS